MNLRHTLLVLLILFVNGALLAQSWTQTNGPENGIITSMASSGNLVIMGTNGGGLYMSSINGDSWGQRAFGTFNAIAVNGSVMVAAGTTTNFHRSTNGGSDWLLVNNGLASDFIWDLEFVGSILFAATNTGGVLRSQNTGDSWTPINNGLGNLVVWSLAVDGTTLYAGTNAGIYKSTNNGDTWTSASTGLGSSTVKAIVVRGSKIFAATNGSGVYVSSNGGGSWAAVNNGLTNQSVYSLAFTDVSTLYAGTANGAFKSTDDGANWAAVGAGIKGTDVDVVFTKGTYVFASTRGNGVFRSDDGGASWNPKNSKIIASQIRALAVNGNTAFAGGFFNGISRTTDGGSTWTNSGLTSEWIDFVLINNGYVYACTSTGIYRSDNNGDSWTLKVNGLASPATTTMATHAGKLYAGSSNEVYRSSDNGDSWMLATNGLPAYPVQVTSIIGLGSFLFAGTSTGGVYRSADEGSNWTPMNMGLTNTNIRNLTANGATLLAATTTGGVFRSADNGGQWTAANTGLNSLNMRGLLAVDGLLLASGYCSGCVHTSTDNGTTWFYAGDGLIDTPREFAAGGGNIFSGSGFSGVYKRPLLLISSFTPTAGAPGTEVVISGFGFDSTTPSNNVVTFQNVAATVTSATATTLTVVTPAAPYGRISVQKGTAYAVSTENFAVLPTITGFTPSSAPVGATVTILGSGFNPVASQNVVYLNDQQVTATSATGSTLTFVVPSNASSGKIKITVFGNPVVSANNFLVTPTISSFTPASGPTGTQVTINGASFSLSNTEVRVNGLLATINEKYTTLLKVIVPDGATTGKIKVTVDGQEVSTSTDFTVLPRVSAFVPTGARVGKQVVIYGTSFSTTPSENVVKFGTVAAVITEATSTQLTTTVPVGAVTDFVSVTVNGNTAVSPNQFVVTYTELLTITSITPTSGLPGTLVTIKGTGFSTQPGINLVGFTGAASPAGVPTYSATELTAYVPSDATTGPITIDVSGDETTSTQVFTVLVPKQNQLITFGEVSPRTVGDPPFTVSASASSGLPVTFSTTSDKISIAGNTIAVLRAGAAKLAADQSGNDSYNAAPRVERTFCINPAKPTVTRTGENGENVTLTSSAATGNQWYVNGAVISLATSATLQPTTAGIYKVKVTIEGCESEFSNDVSLLVTGVRERDMPNIRLFPNPVADKLTIDLGTNESRRLICIVSADGRKVVEFESGNRVEELNVSEWSYGIYHVKVSDPDRSYFARFIKR